jgi:hypothetical protein
MKTEKKRVGTKARIRAMKERQGRIAAALFLSIILLIVVFSVYFNYTFMTQPSNQPNNPVFQLKAAIVDQASLSPAGGFNKVFVENVTSTLKQVGYVVDYYSGERVTVDFYRNLATYGYTVLILRTHSSATIQQGEEQVKAPVFLFTSEGFANDRHVMELLTDQLMIASYEAPDPPYYFAVAPRFITSSMNGKFQHTTVIMTGCDGLNNTQMAKAFIEKGAKAYIAWDKAIYFSHTDTATMHLLQHMLTERQTIKQSIDSTMKEVGPDPAENSTLMYYPPEVGDRKIEN